MLEDITIINAENVYRVQLIYMMTNIAKIIFVDQIKGKRADRYIYYRTSNASIDY